MGNVSPWLPPPFQREIGDSNWKIPAAAEGGEGKVSSSFSPCLEDSQRKIFGSGKKEGEEGGIWKIRKKEGPSLSSLGREARDLETNPPRK